MSADKRWAMWAMISLVSCGPVMSGGDAGDGGAREGGVVSDGSAADAGALNCAAPGTVTTATPATVQTATSDFNVTLLACTRTATALACELGTAHEYSEVIDGAVRRIRANGVANHDVGAFPNPGNPNAIAAQSYQYSVPVTPGGAGSALGMVFGILRSGVVLDPGTAERWNDSNSWNYEALRYATAPMYFSGASATDTTRHPTALGVDCNFAHVQPNGAYHYHGVPTAALPTEPRQTFVGWAADGYPIFGRWDYRDPMSATSAIAEMRSSYRLRSGTRPSGAAGPGGAYDGTFRQDWEYVAGLGDLDECNGRTGVVTVDGRESTSYHYVLTNTYPYIPRCFHGTPDSSFRAMGGAMPGADAGAMGPPPADGGLPMCMGPTATMCCGDRVCDGPETRANCPVDCP